MKTFLTIVITAAVTWFVVSFVYAARFGVERLWLLSSVKAPGLMALREIQEDMNAGRHDAAKAKVDTLLEAWRRFYSGPASFSGPGLGDIMSELSKGEAATPAAP